MTWLRPALHNTPAHYTRCPFTYDVMGYSCGGHLYTALRAGRYNNYIRGLSTQLRATEDWLSLSNDVLFTIDTRCFSDCQSY